MPADTRVRADALAHQLDVRAQSLGEVGEFVHEADTGGEHRIGGILGQLGASHIHEHQLVVIALERRVELAHEFDRLRILGPDHDAVRPHEVIDRRTLLEIPGSTPR